MSYRRHLMSNTKIKNYLCFTALDDNSTISLGGTYVPNLEYSENGKSWHTFDSSVTITLRSGKRVYIAGNNTALATSTTNYTNFVMSGTIGASGNIMSLLDKKNFESITTAPNNAFTGLFRNCASLVTAPELPAKSVGYATYYSMFKGCTSLSSTPELVATYYGANAAEEMFNGCTNLVTINGAITTTVTGSRNFALMFKNCTSLTVTPTLPNIGQFQSMFEGCTSLTTITNIPNAVTDTQGCLSMFKGCTSLVTVPDFPVMTLSTSIFMNMFQNCTSLVNAPALPSTSLNNNCYEGMFSGCTSLVNAPSILPATTLKNRCYYGMFKDCTHLVNPPELPATTLADNCYYEMFSGCAITTAPDLPAATAPSSSYKHMFANCKALATPPNISATTFGYGACTYMFQNCTGLTKAPDLIATSLNADVCFSYMFSGAKNITYIKMLALNINVSNVNQLQNWMANVGNTSDRIFVKHIDATWTTSGASGVPSNWKIIYYDPALDKYYLDQNRSTECDDHGNVIN